jgi:hypothetical protein
MGDQLSLANTDGPLEVSLGWRSAEPLLVRWLVNGEILESSRITEETTGVLADGSAGYSAALSLPSDSSLWIRMNLIDERGNTRLLGNPVYFIP